MSEHTAENDAPRPTANRCGWDLCGDTHHRDIPPASGDTTGGAR